MSDGYNRTIIADNWIDKANEALKSACLLHTESLLISCVNRLYYSVFYAVSAALAQEGKEYGKHSAVRASVHRDFVKNGRIPVSCSDIYDKLFEDRQEGDYTPSTSFDVDEVAKLIVEVKRFLSTFIELIASIRKETA